VVIEVGVVPHKKNPGFFSGFALLKKKFPLTAEGSGSVSVGAI
jgi:hypothetical protein